MKLVTHRSWIVSLVLILSPHPARADVLIVDRDGGALFTEIQVAVDAATDGDVILVVGGQTSAYQPFTIDGKSVSVVADDPDVTVLVRPNGFGGATTTVRNLAPGQTVLIRGINTNVGVWVTDCEGAVWFEELHVDGAIGCGAGGTAGARVTNSSRVTFIGCTLRGEVASDSFIDHLSADGLRATTSSVQLFDCDVAGGWGDGNFGGGRDGGAGIRMEASTVTISGSLIRGGAGGLDLGNPFCGCNFSCTGNHGAGGAGVEFVDAASVLRQVESSVSGGVADLGALCPGMTGPRGPDIAGAGLVMELPGVARHLTTDGPVRTGESLVFDIGGVPGEFVLLLVSPIHDPAYIPVAAGVLLGGLPPIDWLNVGALPASGVTQLSINIPSAAVFADGVVLYAQGVFVNTSPTVRLGGGAAIVILGAGS